jgi:predicted LPLAT superfamily acyltransferase
VKACAIVPSHNHWTALGGVVEVLRRAGLAVFIIDDGSAEPARSAIASLHDPDEGILVTRFEVNQGKGAAVIEGFRQAHGAGFSHALQVDADGQHDLAALPQMLEMAARSPGALITGLPQYDSSIPTGRKIGRWITHVWVWVETQSLQIKDSMCGFRVYPLEATTAMLNAESVGLRMDFDTDIMVRLFWRGVPVLELPVKVIYPPDNISNFDLWRDNLRISWMHTRLVCQMLLDLPKRLAKGKAPERSVHWADLRERGALWGLDFCTLAYRVLGRRGCMAVMALIVGWFFLAGAEQRTASRRFLGRIFNRPPSLWESYRHFLEFAGRALDTFIAWTGGIPAEAVVPATPESLKAAVDDPRGALIVVAHLGNVDVARAVLDDKTRQRMTILVHTQHARNYNRILRRFRPEAALNLLEVTEIGPDTAIALKQRVERGDWVVIAGDRVPLGSQGRISDAPFLGEAASFSQGPWILASLLGCPVHLLFCLKDGEGWSLSLEPFASAIELPRRKRDAALLGHVTAYAARLEEYARRAPFQWFNFFDFWAH